MISTDDHEKWRYFLQPEFEIHHEIRADTGLALIVEILEFF